jgi:hypothetical protein
LRLDQYLEIRREEYVSHYTKSRTLKREYPKFLQDNFPNLPPIQSVSRKTYFEVDTGERQMQFIIGLWKTVVTVKILVNKCMFL